MQRNVPLWGSSLAQDAPETGAMSRGERFRTENYLLRE